MASTAQDLRSIPRASFTRCSLLLFVLALGCVGTDGSGGNSAGATSSSGGSANGGTTGAAGSPPASGTTSGGGAATAGALAAGGASSAGAPSGSCGSINMYPMGCEFGWGAPNQGSRSSYLDFVSVWVGYEARGGLNGACDGCNAARQLASGSAMLVYYAYFIGYQANLLGGFGDCNVDRTDGHNLCSDGAQWIRANRALILQMYAEYARRTYQESPNRPVIWWLEGDFIQYTYDDQVNALTMAELGTLARDITCAIKSNMPNAVVAMNHSPWNADEVTNAFWASMPMDVIDMVWTSGAGDNSGYTRPDFNARSYNALTNNYAYLHQKTGRTIMVDTSYASASQPDRWTSAAPTALNDRVRDGVVGALTTNPSSTHQSDVLAKRVGLNPVCQ